MSREWMKLFLQEQMKCGIPEVNCAQFENSFLTGLFSELSGPASSGKGLIEERHGTGRLTKSNQQQEGQIYTSRYTIYS
jgi:hypothetical protein